MQPLNQNEALYISPNSIALSLDKYFCFALYVLQFHRHLLKKITTASFEDIFSSVKPLGQQVKLSGPPSFPKGALTFTGNYVWHLSHVGKVPMLL